MGYVTNFGLAHLEGFGGPEGVVRGKSELFRYLNASKGTALVYYGDARQLTESFDPRIVFGSGDTYTADEQGRMSITWRHTTAKSHLIGDFQDRALSAAVAIGSQFGLSDSAIARGIEAYVPQNNRGEWRTVGAYRVFMDAYNANPSSMEASIRNAAQRLNPDTTAYVAGDLFELGDYAAEAHQRMVNVMIELGIVHAVLVGPLFAATKHPFLSLNTTEELCALWTSNPPTAAQIWVKGSRGMALEKAVAVLDQSA
jgi:UDP-N-acetylmuramoyl-tripeptide--D-alanyl-D-alanine ligase